jgi:hypothetical protein
MGAVASAKLLAAGSAWRLTGLDAAGRSLVAALAGGAENEQTLAGILLVRAGDRSVPLITEAISAGATSAALVDVLASIGTDTARTALEGATRAHCERWTKSAASESEATRRQASERAKCCAAAGFRGALL